MPRMMTMIVALGLALPTRAEDKPTAAARQFEELKRAYESALKEYPRKLANAKSDEERDNIVADAPNNSFLPRMNDLAGKYAKDPVSFDVLVYALRHGNGEHFPTEQWERTVNLLEAHHAGSKRMAEVAPKVSAWGEPMLRLLRSVMEKNPDKPTQARACRLLMRARVGL